MIISTINSSSFSSTSENWDKNQKDQEAIIQTAVHRIESQEIPEPKKLSRKLTKKDTSVWRSVGMEKNPKGEGKIYIFELNSLFVKDDRFNEELYFEDGNRLYPAVLPDPRFIKLYLNDPFLIHYLPVDKEVNVKSIVHHFKELGFSLTLPPVNPLNELPFKDLEPKGLRTLLTSDTISGLDISSAEPPPQTKIRVPNRKALQHNWKLLQERRKQKLIDYKPIIQNISWKELLKCVNEDPEFPLRWPKLYLKNGQFLKDKLLNDWDSFTIPDLKLKKVKGIASDEEFIATCLEEIVISDVEFIHDIFVHILPNMMIMLFDYPAHNEYQEKVNRFIQLALQRIRKAKENAEIASEMPYKDMLEIFTLATSFVVDFLMGKTNLDEITRFLDEKNLDKLMEVFKEEGTNKIFNIIYFKKMLGEKYPSYIPTATDLWKELKD